MYPIIVNSKALGVQATILLTSLPVSKLGTKFHEADILGWQVSL